MKRNILSFVFLLGVIFSYSQTIAKQSFEASGDTWTPIIFSTPPCTIGTSVWDYTTSLPGMSPNEGNQFWGVRDLDGSCGGSGFEIITLPNVNISSYSDVAFSFDYNAINLDNNDDLKYELFYDGVSQGEVIVIVGVDGNSNDTGGWLTETVIIPDSVINVSVILSAKNNHNSDRAGFDNVQLREFIINDSCANSIPLIVGNNNIENVVTGTNVNATDSGELPTPNCANYNGNDIWYTAQVPASGVLTIETLNAGSSIDTGIAAYTGSCGNLTQIDCDDDTGSNLYSLINITGLPNTTVYIRVWASNNASSGEFNIVAYSAQCVFTTRWNNSGWNNGLPNSFTTAIINNDYDTAVDGSFESCDCQISSGRTVNIRANDFISIHNDLTVIGTIEVWHQGSLVMTNDNGLVSVSGTVNVHKTTTTLNNFRDFTYWSSPVNTTIGQAFVTVDPTRIFQWDIPSNTTIGDWSIASGNMTPAKGYISEAPNTTPNGGTHSVTFTGNPNNGIVDIPVGFNNDNLTYSDFNLIGNPYPSAINIDDFIQLSNNNEMDGTIWLWTHNTGIDTSGQFLGFDYATYNLTGGTVTALPDQSGGSPPTNNIASGQGFFIRTTNSGTLSFQNSMRLNNQNTQFYRASGSKTSTTTPTQEKNRIWLNIESNTGGAFSQLLIGFFDNATDDYDRGYDGTRLGASWIDFYSKIDTLGYAVQGLSSFTIDKKVSIGFDTYIAKPLTYKISIYDIEGVLNDNDIYLIDHELDIIHNLTLADYQFDVNGEGYFPERFTLQFTNSVLNVDDLELNNNFVLINEESSLLLKASSIITGLKIYDITGRLLIDEKPNNKEYRINTHTIRKGTVLVVNVIFENNQQSIAKKVIIH